MPARAYVLDIQLDLDDGVDPRRVGAVVTVELCGHWDPPVWVLQESPSGPGRV